MPGTLWSAPVPALNNNSLVISPATATLTDISPAQVIINPPQLNVGTRVRLVAHGSYIATTTASTVTYGFYMTAASTATAANNLVATSAVLGVSPAITAVAVTGIPWHLQYWGVIQKISSPVIGTTNATIVGRGICNTGASLTAWAASPSADPADPGHGHRRADRHPRVRHGHQHRPARLGRRDHRHQHGFHLDHVRRADLRAAGVTLPA